MVAGVGGGGVGWLLSTRACGHAVELEGGGHVHASIIWSEVTHVSPSGPLVASGFLVSVIAGNAWTGASSADGIQRGTQASLIRGLGSAAPKQEAKAPCCSWRPTLSVPTSKRVVWIGEGVKKVAESGTVYAAEKENVSGTGHAVGDVHEFVIGHAADGGSVCEVGHVVDIVREDAGE